MRTGGQSITTDAPNAIDKREANEMLRTETRRSHRTVGNTTDVPNCRHFPLTSQQQHT